ncbi:hypothetical protein Tco_0013193 [Tanacetum coccineum]
MTISVILISLDSSKDSVGTPAGRVILFGTIPTTIPDITPVIIPPTTQTNAMVIPTETPIIAPTIPPLPTTSPFLSLDDDTTDSDSPDTPPLPTHGTPFTKITSSTQRSPIIPHRRVMILAPGQPIPHGRLYRYHLNGLVHIMTARKRVGPLPTHHHSSPDLLSTYAGPSRKRRRSPMTFVPALPFVSRALSLVCADLIPSPKRVRDSGYSIDVEVDPRETSLRDDTIVRGNEEPHLEQDIDPEIQAEIDECFAYADALKDRGIDAKVVVEAVDREEKDIPEPAQEGAVEVTYETLGDLVQRFHDHSQAIPVHRILVIKEVQREQGHRIVGVESAVIALTERIAELERDNKRLRGTASVESQRVDQLSVACHICRES